MNDLLAGRRVLVVEDEILILMMIENMLADLGCATVATAGTVAQAIDLIEAQNFDAAMLDMNLDGQDSRRVAEALSERGVPFLYSTGNAARETRGVAGDRPVLRKPFTFEEMASGLSRLLPR